MSVRRGDGPDGGRRGGEERQVAEQFHGRLLSVVSHVELVLLVKSRELQREDQSSRIKIRQDIYYTRECP
jgi:hypothetical protein